ncbi:hypothetical protein pb186bvf_007400 [Paramecium bursaria]
MQSYFLYFSLIQIILVLKNIFLNKLKMQDFIEKSQHSNIKISKCNIMDIKLKNSFFLYNFLFIQSIIFFQQKYILMGCSTSVEIQPSSTLDSRRDYEELIGKKIPKFLIQTHQLSDNEDNDESALAQDNQHYERQKNKAQKKFKGGDDSNLSILENVVKVDRTIQKNDIDVIEKSFKKHFVFFNLTQTAIEQIMCKMFYCTQKRGEYVFKQGDQASCFFVILKGQVEILTNDKQVNVLKDGGYFGEIALLYNATRSASVRTLTDCNFWALDRGSFKKSVEDMMSKEYDDNRRFIETVTFFSFMTAEQRDSIASALITTRFQPGQHIVNEGDQADSYYVIKEGEVSVWKGKNKINTMGPKDSFGEQALYEKSQRGATVKAETEVKCLALGRDTISRILGDKVQLVIFGNIMSWSFENSSTLSQLTKLQQEKIRMKAKIANYKKGQVIFAAQQKFSYLVIVLEGTLEKDNKTQIYKGQSYGDQYLIQSKSQDLITDDYFMSTDGVLATIQFSHLLKVLGGSFEGAIYKNKESHETKIKNIADREDYSYIKVEDLIFIKELGSGQFGWVYQVKHKEMPNYFALKSVSKSQIVEQSLEKLVLQEKTVLELCNFPFIMGFYRTFKDDISVYFLVEFIRGMELFDVIRDIGLLNKSQTQFYIGTLILCLEYMHQKGIVYRDIKPENIMVDDKGIMKMIDLGTCTQINKSKGLRTYTIIGTPHYMAPEIILGKGYSYNVDLWSVGVCAYEFMCGGLPYADQLDDPYEIYEEIMNTQLGFPNYFKDRIAKKLIGQLLSKQPESRLGSSYASLKAHQWFDDFDWDRLFSKSLPPPYIPPEDRMMAQWEMNQKFQQAKPVVYEIKAKQQQQRIKYRKDLAKDPNWDAVF